MKVPKGCFSFSRVNSLEKTFWKLSLKSKRANLNGILILPGRPVKWSVSNISRRASVNGSKRVSTPQRMESLFSFALSASKRFQKKSWKIKSCSSNKCFFSQAWQVSCSIKTGGVSESIIHFLSILKCFLKKWRTGSIIFSKIRKWRSDISIRFFEKSWVKRKWFNGNRFFMSTSYQITRGIRLKVIRFFLWKVRLIQFWMQMGRWAILLFNTRTSLTVWQWRMQSFKVRLSTGICLTTSNLVSWRSISMRKSSRHIPNSARWLAIQNLNFLEKRQPKFWCPNSKTGCRIALKQEKKGRPTIMSFQSSGKTARFWMWLSLEHRFLISMVR